MDIHFEWDGHPISPRIKSDVESSISYGLNNNDEFKNFKSATVHLTNDTLKAVISGVIVNHNNESLFTVNVDPYSQYNTAYEPIKSQK